MKWRRNKPIISPTSQHRLPANRFRGILLLALFMQGGSGVCHAQSSPLNAFQAAIEEAQPKMVKVIGAKIGNVEGYSTGILVSNEGHVLTMQGVFLDATNIRVILADGSEHQASVIRRDRERRLALLKISQSTPHFFELAQEAIGQPGDWVVALTNAFRVADKDEPMSVTLGIVSLRTSIEARLNQRDLAYRGDLVLIDCITSNPGAAGGAVVLPDGQLVGMVGRVIDSSETNTRLNYAVPSDLLRKFVDDRLETDSPTETVQSIPGELGIVIFKLGGRNNPAYVERVQRNSPAAKAGFQPDDLVISINGQNVGTVKQYEDALKQVVANEVTIVVIKRGNEILRVAVTAEPKK
jgi:serine protease Do